MDGGLDHGLGLRIDDHRVLEQPGPVGVRLRQRPQLGQPVRVDLELPLGSVLRDQPVPDAADVLRAPPRRDVDQPGQDRSLRTVGQPWGEPVELVHHDNRGDQRHPRLAHRARQGGIPIVGADLGQPHGARGPARPQPRAVVEQPGGGSGPAGTGLASVGRLTHHLHPAGIEPQRQRIERSSELAQLRAAGRPQLSVDASQRSARRIDRCAAILERAPPGHANQSTRRD